MPWAIAVALWWLLPAGVPEAWTPLTTERYAGKRPARHLEVFKGLKAGKRQPWTPIRSHCCGRGDALSHCCGLVVAFACGRGACWTCWGTVLPAKLGVVHAGVARVGLCAGKRQAATLEQQGLTATGLGATGRRSIGSIVRVWRLANGRLERL